MVFWRSSPASLRPCAARLLFRANSSTTRTLFVGQTHSRTRKAARFSLGIADGGRATFDGRHGFARMDVGTHSYAIPPQDESARRRFKLCIGPLHICRSSQKGNCEIDHNGKARPLLLSAHFEQERRQWQVHNGPAKGARSLSQRLRSPSRLFSGWRHRNWCRLRSCWVVIGNAPRRRSC